MKVTMWVVFLLAAMTVAICTMVIIYIGAKFYVLVNKLINEEKELNKEKEN